MAIRVTEILGTDSMNNSRITINNNFRTLSNTINKLESEIRSSIEMGDVVASSVTSETLVASDRLEIGGVQLDGETLSALIALLNSQTE